MDREGFRNRLKQYKQAREENPGLKYYDFMERLAEFKAKEWDDDPDMVLTHMLNDNSYNYRQMYEDDPNYNIEEGHFVDTYKTVHHPTFSEESMYSGKKSQYNPEGVVGGSWDESTKSFYIKDARQSRAKAQNYLNRADPGYRAIPKYDEGTDGVTGPPTYEQWDADMNKYNPTILDDASMYWSIEAAKKALHNEAMKLPGYAERWTEYYRSLPKNDPDINEFVDELWANENPNNVGLKNGKYYPHKSPEGGKPTIGPGFKIGSGSHRITKKQAERGMTKARLNQEARYIGKQHLNAVDQFINYGQTTNPADTVSPQIKMGLMDLRHQVGPLNEWGNLRQAVLNGDLEGIRKESTVTWNDDGKIKVDKRRKKIRDEKYFYYE